MSETKPSNRQDNIKQIDFNKIACVQNRMENLP